MLSSDTDKHKWCYIHSRLKQPCSLSTQSPSYLFEAAHEIVANRRSGQVGSAGAPTHVEKVIGAQHGVILLGVASSGEDPIHRDSHLLRGNT